ncbi:MAG: (deoxy)nucleoside triphosphate pyrophosphohydrolase [Bacteroidales bacterium]|nr:(deoxy)nucleoside triphosphate pyrophosphohydrolase [Bacteroidales bacterium]
MRHIHVSAAIFIRDGRVLSTQRGYGEWKDWWEFPGGKIEPGESAEDALKREIREEMGTDIAVERLLITIDYDYPKFHITMYCFQCSVAQGELTLLEHEDAKWLNRKEIDSVKWLPADKDVVALLKSML